MAYLYAAATLLLEQHVFRLHVTVNDFVSVEQVQALEQTVSKLSHQLQRESLEFVLLDQLVQVDAQQFKRDASVGAKDEMVEHVDDVVGVFLVLLAQVLQDADLLLGLSVEPFLVAHHLEGHVEMALVVVGLDHLAEAAFSNDFQHFVAVGEVVVRDVRVGALVVVVLAVVGRADDARTLLGVRADEVDLVDRKSF